MAEKTASGLISGRTVPVLPLRDTVLFPFTTVPFFIGRRMSLNAIEEAQKSGGFLFFVAQRVARDDLQLEDFFTVGTLAKIIDFMFLPEANVKILVEGLTRARIEVFTKTGAFFQAEIAPLIHERASTDRAALLQTDVTNKLDRYCDLVMLRGVEPANEGPFELASRVASLLQTDIAGKQRILEMLSVEEQLESCANVLDEMIAELDQHTVNAKEGAQETLLATIDASVPTALDRKSLNQLLCAACVTAYPPTSDESIRRFETQFGAVLSKAFKSFLKSSNGLRFFFSFDRALEMGVSPALADMNTIFGIDTVDPGLDLNLVVPLVSYYDRKFIPFASLIGLGGDFCTFLEINQGSYEGQIMYTDGELFSEFKQIDVSKDPVDALVERFVAQGWFAPIAPSFSALIDLYARLT